MAKTHTALPPDRLKRSLLDLSLKQVELRQRLVDYLANSEETAGSISRQTGMNWVAVKGFLDGKLCLSGGKGLKGLCRLLECEDLGNKIATLSAAVGDRYLALATHSPEVIETAIELVTAQRQRADEYTGEDFAGAFGKLAPIVKGVLNGSQSALDQLEDADTLWHIQTQMKADLDDPIEEAKQRRLASQLTAAKRLSKLVEPLLERYGGRTMMAKALGIHRTSLYDALNGKASVEHTQKLIQKAERLSNARAPAAEPVTEQKSAPEPIPAPDRDVWSVIGGTTTEEGVQYVLTEESFQELEQVPLVALRDAMRKVLPMSRLLLNIGSQCKDKQAREILQEALEPEVQELSIAIREFTFAHPNRLLELYDSQRQVWANDNKKKPSSRKVK